MNDFLKEKRKRQKESSRIEKKKNRIPKGNNTFNDFIDALETTISMISDYEVYRGHNEIRIERPFFFNPFNGMMGSGKSYQILGTFRGRRSNEIILNKRGNMFHVTLNVNFPLYDEEVKHIIDKSSSVYGAKCLKNTFSMVIILRLKTMYTMMDNGDLGELLILLFTKMTENDNNEQIV